MEREILFFKIIRNKYLFRKILFFICNQIVFTDFRNYQISKRILFKQITSVEWMIKNKQYSLLSMKLVKESEFIHLNVKKLIQDIKYITDKKEIIEIKSILKLLYQYKKDEMKQVDLIECSMAFNSLIALESFLELTSSSNCKSPPTPPSEIMDIGIVNASYQCLLFINEISKKRNNEIYYTESDLIKNALDSNEPDKMLIFIRDNLKLDLLSLIKKHCKPNNLVKNLSIFFLQSIQFKLLILENNYLLDKQDTMVISTESSTYGNDNPNQNSLLQLGYTISNLQIDHLKVNLLERYYSSINRSKVIKAIENINDTGTLLEMYKKDLNIQWITYNLQNGTLERIEPFFKGLEYSTSEILSTHLLKVACIYFNVNAYYLYEKVSEANTSSLSEMTRAFMVKKEQLQFGEIGVFNYYNDRSLIQPVENVVQFINIAIKKDKNVFHIIFNVLFIVYPIDTITRVINECQEFSNRLSNLLKMDMEIIKLIWKNPNIPFENLKLLLSIRTTPFPRRGLSVFISNHSDSEKIQILNSICKIDEKCQLLELEYRKELIENYLRLNVSALENCIEIYNLLYRDSNVVGLKNEIIYFLFNKFILNLLFKNGIDNGEIDKESNNKLILIINSVNQKEVLVQDDEELSIITIIIKLFQILKNDSINLSILEKSIQLEKSDSFIIQLIGIYFKSSGLIPKNQIFNLLLTEKRYNVVKYLIGQFKENNIKLFNPNPFTDPSIDIYKLFENNQKLLSNKFKFSKNDFFKCSEINGEYLINEQETIQYSTSRSFTTKKEIFVHLIQFSNIEFFKKLYPPNKILNNKGSTELKWLITFSIKFNRLDILEYCFQNCEFTPKSIPDTILIAIQFGNYQILNYFLHLNNSIINSSNVNEFIDQRELFIMACKHSHLNCAKLIYSFIKLKFISISNDDGDGDKVNSFLNLSIQDVYSLLSDNKYNILEYLYDEKIISKLHFQHISLETNNILKCCEGSKEFSQKPPKDSYTYYVNYLYPTFISPNEIKVSSKLYSLILKIKQQQ